MTTYEPADWRPEPGDVAEVTWDGETQRRFCTDTGAWWGVDGWIPGDVPTRARRLLVVDPASTVVLDPEREADVDSVADAIRDHHKPSSLQVEIDWLAVQAALRSLLPAATPPEPNGLAVDARYGPIVRTHEGHWLDRSHSRVEYLPQQVEEITQHGVGCSCGAPDCNWGDQ